MKYIIYNETTGEIADIVSTILENRPMIIPMSNPLNKNDDYNWDNCQVKDANKANRALDIFIQSFMFDSEVWHVKEIKD